MSLSNRDESFREATAADLEGLVVLEEFAFEGPWSTAQLSGQLAHSGSLTFVATGQAGAFDAYATFTLVAGEAELLRIAVRPGARGKGLAKNLLRLALDRLAGREIAMCHLEVRADNTPALGLYRSLGFEEVGRRNGYYPDKTAALLLRLSPLAARLS